MASHLVSVLEAEKCLLCLMLLLEVEQMFLRELVTQFDEKEHFVSLQMDLLLKGYN